MASTSPRPSTCSLTEGLARPLDRSSSRRPSERSTAAQTATPRKVRAGSRGRPKKDALAEPTVFFTSRCQTKPTAPSTLCSRTSSLAVKTRPTPHLIQPFCRTRRPPLATQLATHPSHPLLRDQQLPHGQRTSSRIRHQASGARPGPAPKARAEEGELASRTTSTRPLIQGILPVRSGTTRRSSS